MTINKKSLKEEGVDVSVNQANKIREHFNNPKNNKKLENYNARGVGRNPDNWGQVDMYILLDENEVVSDIGYEYKGCPTISFTASVFTEELKGTKLMDSMINTKAELDVLNAQNNCDDCIKMILVAFICACENYIDRFTETNIEDYNFKMIETTIPYTSQNCS